METQKRMEIVMDLRREIHWDLPKEKQKVRQRQMAILTPKEKQMVRQRQIATEMVRRLEMRMGRPMLKEIGLVMHWVRRMHWGFVREKRMETQMRLGFEKD